MSMTILLPLFFGLFFTVSGFSPSISCITQTQTNSNNNNVEPWIEAEITYAAANEFIAEHYQNFGSEDSYFEQDYKKEPIYNAREGVLVVNNNNSKNSEQQQQQQQQRETPSLLTSGFELVGNLTTLHNNRIDWDDLQSVREHFLPVVREKIACIYGGEEAIEDTIFWSPTKRHVDFKPNSRNPVEFKHPPKASYVGMAHIDTDFNAYSHLEDFLKVVNHSRFPGIYTDGIPTINILKKLRAGQRFAIVNAWLNIGLNPIQRAPLAFMPMQYVEPNRQFPKGTPDFDQCHWYLFPHMQPDEMLLFCQYDRNAAFCSDLWHCALKDVGTEAPPRDSFDVRALVIFKETVQDNGDRLLPSQLQ